MDKRDKLVLQQFLGNEAMSLIAEHERLVGELNMLGPDTEEYDRVNKQREKIAKDITEIYKIRCEEKRSKRDIVKTILILGGFAFSTGYESVRPVFTRSWQSLSTMLSRQGGRQK